MFPYPWYFPLVLGAITGQVRYRSLKSLELYRGLGCTAVVWTHGAGWGLCQLTPIFPLFTTHN